MRTTLEIDEAILKEVSHLTGLGNKSKAVTHALTAYIQERKIERLIALLGKVDIESDWRNLRDGELDEER